MRWWLFFCVLVSGATSCSRTSIADALGNGDDDGDGDEGDPLPVDDYVVLPIAGTDRWNAYVAYSGGPLLSIDGTACADPATYRTCIHAGELRRLDLPLFASCEGLTVTDSRGVFDWTCIAHDGAVTLVSTGLAEGKGLRDLIDFTTPAFFSMHLTVKPRTGTTIVTRDTLWWSNPVLSFPADGASNGPTITTTDAIIVAPTSHSTFGLTINAPGVSVVTAPQAQLGLIAGPSECQGITLGTNTVVAAQCTVVVKADRAWIEASIVGTATFGGQSLGVQASRWLRVHRTYLGRNRFGLIMIGANGARITASTVEKSGSVVFDGVNGSLVRDLLLAVTDTYFVASGDNVIENLTTFGNYAGIDLNAGNHDNHFIRPLSFAHSDFGFQAAGGSNVRNTMVGFTLANNGVQNLGAFAQAANNTFHLGLLVNTTEQGADINSVNDTFSHFVSSASGFNTIQFDTAASLNRFAGNIRLGLFGGVACGSSSSQPTPGLASTTCATQGLSVLSFTQTTLASLANTFVGWVDDDEVNATDQPGGTPIPADTSTFDFAGSGSRYRGWIAKGTTFLDANERNCAGHTASGCWTDTAQTAMIADWRFKATDTLLRNTTLEGATQNPAFVDGALCPAGLSSFFIQDLAQGETLGDGDGICEGGETCSGNFYLLAAIEVIDDYIGDDDGLCESGEACIYAPNYGAYQGEGDYTKHQCVFTDGQIENVTMYAYPTNGVGN